MRVMQFPSRPPALLPTIANGFDPWMVRRARAPAALPPQPKGLRPAQLNKLWKQAELEHRKLPSLASQDFGDTAAVSRRIVGHLGGPDLAASLGQDYSEWARTYECFRILAAGYSPVHPAS